MPVGAVMAKKMLSPTIVVLPMVLCTRAIPRLKAMTDLCSATAVINCKTARKEPGIVS